MHALFECSECMADKNLRELCKTFPKRQMQARGKQKATGGEKTNKTMKMKRRRKKKTLQQHLKF